MDLLIHLLIDEINIVIIDCLLGSFYLFYFYSILLSIHTIIIKLLLYLYLSHCYYLIYYVIYIIIYYVNYSLFSYIFSNIISDW